MALSKLSNLTVDIDDKTLADLERNFDDDTLPLQEAPEPIALDASLMIPKPPTFRPVAELRESGAFDRQMADQFRQLWVDTEVTDKTKIRLFDPQELLEPAQVEDEGFLNLATAEGQLAQFLQSGENLKLKAARVAQKIRDRELWREAGCANFKDYLPRLLTLTEAVGWGAERTIKAYITFVALYLDQLAIPENEAIKAVTHLQLLVRLADLDRKTGELIDPSKEGKLSPEAFESTTRIVSFLVNTPEWANEGADASTVAARCAVLGLGPDAVRFEETFGFYPVLPRGGWQVADTKNLIALLTPKKEEEAEEEEQPKIRRVWTTAGTFSDGAIHLTDLEVYYEGHCISHLHLDEPVEPDAFEKMTAGDEVNSLGDDDAE